MYTKRRVKWQFVTSVRIFFMVQNVIVDGKQNTVVGDVEHRLHQTVIHIAKIANGFNV